MDTVNHLQGSKVCIKHIIKFKTKLHNFNLPDSESEASLLSSVSFSFDSLRFRPVSL